jgi:hypothetical protein
LVRLLAQSISARAFAAPQDAVMEAFARRANAAKRLLSHFRTESRDAKAGRILQQSKSIVWEYTARYTWPCLTYDCLIRGMQYDDSKVRNSGCQPKAAMA